MKKMNETQKVLLELLGTALFKKQNTIESCDWKAVYREADAHKVFPLVFDVSKDCIAGTELFQTAQRQARHCVAATLRVRYAHAALGNLLEQNNIPYVIMKGVASAAYYPQPLLRISGDVDFFVCAQDIEKAKQLLVADGFWLIKEDVKDLAFEKADIRYEMHRGVRGTPKNAKGERLFQAVFSDLIDTVVDYTVEDSGIKVPDAFHHGMILLLHTLAHLTGPGIGLRHLCDWAVFEASLSDEQFRALFEPTLRQYGLWRFAQLFSLCANRYLGAPYREWQGQEGAQLLQSMIADILCAGNFGEKDVSRTQQIKYISDVGELTVKGGSLLRQAKKTIARKAAVQNKSKVAVIVEYAKKVVGGKRKPDTKKTLEAAAERKALYAAFHLFEE